MRLKALQGSREVLSGLYTVLERSDGCGYSERAKKAGGERRQPG